MRIDGLFSFLKSGNTQEKVMKTIKENVPSFEDTLKSTENSPKFIPFTKDGFMSDNSSLIEMFKFFDAINQMTTDPSKKDTSNKNDLEKLMTGDINKPVGYDDLESLPKNLKEEIEKTINEASSKYHVPKELIYAIIDQESAFNPYSVNHNKDGTTDRGLMQVNYDHNKDIMKEFNIEDKNQLFDIKTNIEIGTAILAKDFEKYGNWPTAIKAYNGINADNWDYVKSVISKLKKYKNTI